MFAITGLGSNNSEELLRDRQKCKGVSAHRALEREVRADVVVDEVNRG